MSSAASSSPDELTDGAVGAQIEQLTRQTITPDDIGNGLYLTVDGGGRVAIADTNPMLELYGPRPRRKVRVQSVHTPDSFIDYIAKHALPETEIYSDITALAVTGIIDAGQSVADGDGAGRMEHRVVFQVRATPAWVAWKVNDGKWLDQATMAEHIEQRLPDFVDPPGADMLEIAQTFQASRSGSFKSSARLATGETTLAYENQVSATAGASNRLVIPDVFTLQIQPFEGSRAYAVPCRFRYRIRDERLSLSYKIDRAEELVRTAFDDVTGSIADGVAGDGKDVIDHEVWQGSAP